MTSHDVTALCAPSSTQEQVWLAHGLLVLELALYLIKTPSASGAPGHYMTRGNIINVIQYCPGHPDWSNSQY